MSKKKSEELFGIIGLGRFGAALAQTLTELGKEILVLDNHEDKVKHALSFTDNAFTVSSLNQETLEQAGLKNCDVVIICIGEAVEASIMTTLSAIQMGIPRVLAKAISPEHGAVLEKLGAQVIYPERDMAVRVANRLAVPHMLEYIVLSKDMQISEIQLTNKCDGMTVAASNLRGRFSLNIVAISHQSEITVDITPDRMLHAGDMIVVAGRSESLRQFEDYQST